MSSIGLLVPDLLAEIMVRLPLDIDQKFSFAQVSRYWREVALHNHLFWSSFIGRYSKADSCRVPLILERSGSSTMLHVQFSFDGNTDWAADALKALVPYVARIETLDLEFWVYSDRSLPRSTVDALLNSNLTFPVLKTLRLEGPEYGHTPPLLLAAPQLRTLDLQRVDPANLDTLLSPSLESIRLHQSGDTSVETLFDIFNRCPRAWRVALDLARMFRSPDTNLESFALRRPLAPALRDLELGLRDIYLDPLLRAAFSDVVLHTLTACIYNSDTQLLAEALLPGVGPLTVFEIFDTQQVELRDEAGRIRRFQCWNEDSSFEVDKVWEYLSIHYGLHKTVREIRIRRWDEYVEVFDRYPPQLQDGITLVFDAYWNIRFPVPTDDEGDNAYITKTMRIPGLAKVTFHGAHLLLRTILQVLAHIERPTARKVVVCIGNKKLLTADVEQDTFCAFQTALSGECWAICSQ